MRHGGQILIHQLKIQGCRQIFSVPGQETTAILEGLYEIAQVQTITCRHENNAAIMAEAKGRISDSPGICLVSGVSGALKASIGLQLAIQNETPLIMLVALPANTRNSHDSSETSSVLNALQNITKEVFIVESTSLIPDYVSRACHAAISGNPGPVILGLPENVITDRAYTEDLPKALHSHPSASQDDINNIKSLLEGASRPVLIVGGSGWNEQTSENIATFASNYKIPVFTSFNCQDYINNSHPQYAGSLTPDMPESLEKFIINADLIIAIGTSLDRNTTINDSLIKAPRPVQQLIHIHADTAKLGRRMHTTLPINASSSSICKMLAGLPAPERLQWTDWQNDARSSYEDTLIARDTPGEVKLEYVVRILKEVLPENTIITHGTGNYASWLHRYYKYEQYGTQLAPGSNHPEYALPAAIAAKLSHPQRTVVAITGDGGFMMSASELATAMHFGLKIIVLVVNNRMYGGARKQQEKERPGHVLGTSLTNPDFLKLAESFGAEAEVVEHRKAFRTVLKRALTANKTTVIELKTDENALSPELTLNDLSR